MQASLIAQMVKKKKIHLQCRRPGFDLWVRKIPWRKEWLPTPVFLPGELHGQRSLAATVHGVTKSWTGLNNEYFHLYLKQEIQIKICQDQLLATLQ